MENTLNINQNTEVCQQCGKHCPLDALSCGKGRSFYGVESEEAGSGYESHGRHGDHGDYEGHEEHEWHGKRGHGKEEGHGKQEGHGRHEGRGGHREDDSLMGLLRQSGHYLYHKKNGGRGLGQGKILSILSDKECMSQKELQEELGIQPGSMSELIQKLEEKNFVKRRKDENDKRKVLVSITEAGKVHVQDIKEEKEERDLFAVLSEEEQTQLSMLMKKLLASWNTAEDRGHRHGERGSRESGDGAHSHRGNGHWKN